MPWAIAAAVIAALAAATTAYASYQQGQEQKKASDFNAKMAEYNADMAKQTAKAKAELQERENRRRLGAIRQQYAAGGVEPTAGTSLTVLMDSAAEAEKDLVRIRAGGEAQAWSYLSESQIQSSMGKSYQQAGTIGAGGSLLAGASRVTSIYVPSKVK